MNQKTALITGASSGIGKSLAHIHASKGGNLVLVARRELELNELKKEIENKYNVKVSIFSKDLTVPNAVNDLLAFVKAEQIEIDYLINNAGFGGMGRFYKRKWEDDKKMIQLNIIVLAELTRAMLPLFLEKKCGKILNVSSTASLMPGPLQAVYYATKAFVTSFSNAISEELVGSGITVTNLMPGPTDTEFGIVSGMDKTSLFKKASTADKVATDGYNAMISGKLNVISGVPFFLRLQMLIIPLVPKKIVLKMVKNKQEFEK